MRIAALSVFLLSGFAALLYQVVWQRILVIFSGADVYSSTLIVAAFMGGLGVGYLAGGHVADRISRASALLLFVAAEAAIAAFGLVSRGLYYDVLYQRLGPLAFAPLLLTGILFVSLLWPTFFMGFSLPVLARALTDRVERAAFTVGSLYAFNTLGAAAGALAATWIILPSVGLDVALRFAAVLNVVSAAIVLPLVPRLRRSDREARPSATDDSGTPAASLPAPGLRRLPRPVWAAVYALSGFLALGLEITWFRLLAVMMKSTSFTFGTLLAIYLAGIGGGALVGCRVASRLRRPDIAFLMLQAAAGLSAGLLLTLLIAVAEQSAWLNAYFASYEPISVRESLAALRDFAQGAAESPGGVKHFLVLYFALPAALIFPPTVLLGASFPVLQRVVQTDLARLGRRVGLLQLANVAGGVLGTIAVGWLALDAIGTAWSMKALTVLSAAFLLPLAALTAAARKPGRWVAPAAVMISIAAVALCLPDSRALWGWLHGVTGSRMIAGEDASGLSVLRLEAGDNPAVTVFVNGKGQSTLPYGDLQTALGMLPAFLHPEPRTAAIIGLGSGNTAYAVAGRQELTRIVSIEIVRPQLDGLRALRARYQYGGLAGLLDDRRIEHYAGDGRLWLAREDATFDIIEADARRPKSAYSGYLYSVEYFELVRRRLRPRGLAATWAPTARVHDTFVRVFPHVVWVPEILIGSNEPIDLDPRAIAARLEDARVRDHYARAGIDAVRMMREHLVHPTVYRPGFDRSALSDVNTDLFPKDEFDLRSAR